MAITTRKHVERTAGREVLKLTSKLVKRTVAERLSAPREALSALTEQAGNGGTPLVARLRSVPIQCSIDIAVPLAVAYEEWMNLKFLPEGVHTVRDLRRRGDRLRGSISGVSRQRSLWRAEIKEERREESFAWRSLAGSDCLGLVTFHRLAERLTRLEVELDVVPAGPAQAFELLTHIADRRAEADLRRFKAELERISPDDYASLVDEASGGTQGDND
ncbi:MAG: hypothetical protein JOZ58_09075, partial [Acetobacteraceae bacterium]|nr:hypothetical protein [Acetobacteraceae bacterium]